MASAFKIYCLTLVLPNSQTRRGRSQIQLDLSNIQGKKAVLIVKVPLTGGKAVLGSERKSSLFRIDLRVFTALVQEFLHLKLSHETKILLSNQTK